MFKATEGRWGSREIEITDVDAARRRRPAVARVPLRRARPACGIDLKRAHRRSTDFVVRRRHLQRRRRLLLRHQHVHRGAEGRSSLDGEGRVTFAIESARSGRGHLQARRRRPQARRLPVRLPPAALHLPREVAHEGRRHLPPEASLGVLGDVRFERKASATHVKPTC